MRSSHDRMMPDGYDACPVDVAFNIVGKKWTVLLIRNMLRGHRHFNQFLANIPGLNPKTLSTRLKELEQERIVTKHVSQTSPVRIEYRLTDKGLAVLPILQQMVRWSVTWAPERLFGSKQAPHDADRCLQEWQATIVGLDAYTIGKKGPVIVRVRPPARRRA